MGNPMAHSFSTILSLQDELARQALSAVGDMNEAGLLVGRVMSRAFDRMEKGEAAMSAPQTMRRDLDALIRKMKQH